ncbi:endopeptidase La [bacterium]|nr:endopeptidase La [bacterium]
MNGSIIKSNELPLLPLRDIVLFPHMVIPLFVGRPMSIAALENATLNNRLILLSAQKDPDKEDPTPETIYEVGCVAEILQLLKLPDKTIKALVEGLGRAKIKRYLEGEDFFKVEVEEVEETWNENTETEAIMRSVTSQFEDYVRLNRRLPPETIQATANIEAPGRLADIVATHLVLKLPERQSILETIHPIKRLEKLSVILAKEIEVLEIEKNIQIKVRKQMEKSQKEYYLTEQMKAIQEELGRKDEMSVEVEELKKQIKEAKMSKEAEEKAEKELSRLEKMPPMAAEATVIRNYIDWLVCLPWHKKSRDKLNIKTAEETLEKNHYGLSKVKERILEHLAVRKLVRQMKGPILCFVGPPGTGKTSVGKSIATALGREFVRVSLGGVRDEAEIRGHRMTYVAALPGRIIQSMKKVKTRNPLFLLDEIDKMSTDFRGDPSAALLEVLDPEQNINFSDHYLEVPFDLSEVMFITTANILYTVPSPLRDRMEILEFPSYTEEEKLHIAKKFLMDKNLKKHGLAKENISFSDSALLLIIQRYTREAGVRNLDREIANICRKIAKEIVEKKKKDKVTAKNIHCYLGPPKYKLGETFKENKIGVATGLAWTEAGGAVLTVETIIMHGKGSLTLTGQLGDVMKESAQAALSYVRSRANLLGLDPNFYKKVDVHIHVPEGAIPKDGPSAGVTMTSSLVSALTQKPLNRSVAMTGEITLRGEVLPVGGIKEKILAAHRFGVKEVIIPHENEKDLIEIPKNVRAKIKIHLIKEMDEVLKLALVQE